MLSRNPKLRKCDMKKCQGFCCYDGVYLSATEEERLRKIIQTHTNEFPLSVDDYFTDGNWHDRVKGRKTAVVKFKYPSHFSSHFNQTKCIFSDKEGLCAFQKLAIKEGLHPWSYKPLACCLFPLVERNGVLIPPPNNGEKDDYYIDETYQGFINCLYCGQDCSNGKDWKEVLAAERDWFNKKCKLNDI